MQQRSCSEILLARFCSRPRDHPWWVSESRHLHRCKFHWRAPRSPTYTVHLCRIFSFLIALNPGVNIKPHACARMFRISTPPLHSPHFMFNTSLTLKTKVYFAAMNALNGEDLQGARLEISLAKVTRYNLPLVVNTNLQPPSDKKKKEEMLRKREQRMMQAMAERFVNISSKHLLVIAIFNMHSSVSEIFCISVCFLKRLIVSR